MRTTTCLSSVIASVVVAGTLFGVPDTARAQQPPARTHAVTPGETLWRIAAESLGDGHRWREILALNRDVVSEPRLLRSGSVLRLPAAPPPASDSAVVSGVGTSSDEAGAADGSGMTAVGASPAALDTDAKRDAAAIDSLTGGAITMPDTQGRTIFAPVEPVGRSATSRTMRTTATAPTVRVGEFYAAPYPVSGGGPAGSGRIVSTADEDRHAVTGIARHVQMFERVVIEPPAGATPVAGDRLLAWRAGPRLAGGLLVVVPVGIVTVEQSRVGEPVIGRVTSNFETVTIGIALTPLAAPPPPDLATPRPVTDGREGRVLWVDASPALASLQSYLVLDLGADDGLRAGDQVVLFRTGAGDPEHTGAEFRIATASVVRVTSDGASAIVIAQREPAISAGARVRVSAAVP